MSRIGRQLISIPDGVTVTIADDSVAAKGPKGELTLQLPKRISVKQEDGALNVHVQNEETIQSRTLWGTYGSLVKNLVVGVSEGFSKTLELNGVGFRWAVSGKTVKMSLGFSHEVEYELPEGIEATVEKLSMTISGADKALVGQVAAEIRALKKPEPYKGKGIKYADEQIRRKAGKQVAAGGGSA